VVENDKPSSLRRVACDHFPKGRLVQAGMMLSSLTTFFSRQVLARVSCEPVLRNTYAELAQQAACIRDTAGGVGLDV
jgi:hypothetical protein